MRQLLFSFLTTLLVLPLCSPSVLSAQVSTTPQATASPVAGLHLFVLTEEQVPGALVTIQDGERTLDDVASGFADPDAAAEQFVEWGWQRNLVRAFHLPENAEGDPSEIDGIYMSVHEFGSSDAAAAALDYSFDVHAAGGQIDEVPVPEMGEYSRALYGRLSYGHEITLYVQQGNVLIRLSAASPEGDPREEAIELMQTILGPGPGTPAARN